MKKILLHYFTWLLISANIFAGTLKVGATPVPHAELLNYLKSAERSEERRVGKECRSRWSPYH